MAGIYIHIPFCRKACTYCNFHFSTTLKNKDAVINAIIKEINDYVIDTSTTEKIETIYFGGGTPSLLSVDELNKILTALKKFSISSDAEITLEANPDDINETSLNNWVSLGINRLSVGIQTFSDEELKWMNRAHDKEDALRCLQLISGSPIKNYSTDLIYGSPFLSDEELVNNINLLVSKKIPHISCYALTVETKTALHYSISKNLSPDVDPEKQSRQFLIVMDLLAKAGYIHYEISNFSLPDMQSRHNKAYWEGKAYIGFGPAAHSFNGIDTRSWNVANNIEYTRLIESNANAQTKEVLTKVQQLNELIMISLRTDEGINLKKISINFGNDKSEEIIRISAKHILRGHLKNEDGFIKLTNQGNLFADGIAADMFF